MSAETSRLRLRPSLRLRYHRWGADVVLFDEVSGDTHLIPVAALELLRELSGSSPPSGEQRSLAEDEEAAQAIDSATVTPQLIQELARLRLVDVLKP